MENLGWNSTGSCVRGCEKCMKWPDRQCALPESRQKRAYDTRCCGQEFHAGDKVWVFCPDRKKGISPKLSNQWVGPCTVLERLSDVVYRVRVLGRRKVVTLHRDRLAPYRPLAPAGAEIDCETAGPAPTLVPAPSAAPEAALAAVPTVAPAGRTPRPHRLRHI